MEFIGQLKRGRKERRKEAQVSLINLPHIVVFENTNGTIKVG
jgi:hypothetical protein